MVESGRLSKVNHLSADQRAGRLDFIRKKAAPNGGGLVMQLSREARLMAGLTIARYSAATTQPVALRGSLEIAAE